MLEIILPYSIVADYGAWGMVCNLPTITVNNNDLIVPSVKNVYFGLHIEQSDVVDRKYVKNPIKICC